MNKRTEELPDILDARTVKDYLGISQAGVYNLMHRKDFPTLHIGNRLMVMKAQLLEWLIKNTDNYVFD